MIERFIFSVNADILLGVAGEFRAVQAPDIAILADTMMANAPCPGFATVTAGPLMKEGESFDAFLASPSRVPVKILFEEKVPVTIAGHYTGYVPEQYRRGERYTLCFTFWGPRALPKDQR